MIKKWGFFKSRSLPTEFGALWLLRITMVVPLVLSLAFQPLFAYAQTPSPSPNMKELLAKYGKPCNIPFEKQTPAIKEQCSAIKMAKTTIGIESAKMAISTAALIALITLTATAPINPGAIAACNGLGYGVMASNTAMDIGGIVANAKEKKKLEQSLDASSIMTPLTGRAAGILMQQLLGKNMTKKAAQDAANKAAVEASSKGTQAVTEASNKATKEAVKSVCKGHAISVGFDLLGITTSLTTAIMAKQSAQKTVDELGKSLSETTEIDPRIPSFNNGLTHTGSSKVNMPSAVVENVESKDDGSAGSDAAKAALNALGVSKQANQLLSKALGQDLAKFAANAPTDPSKMSNYVSGALGLGSAGAAAIDRTKDKLQEIAKKNGLLEKLGMGYASVGKNAPSSDSSDPDFNKMMKDMMKALNPGEEESAQNAGEDPAEAAFRRMELLPPEKIEANKDISLFARIGFRYRKALPKVDELNWAIPENQSAGNPRLPAQDSQSGQSRR